MYNPCFECMNRFNRQYTEDCDDKCEFAHVVKENSKLKVEGEWVYDSWCTFKCSECGAKRDKYKGEDLTPYCAMCGTKMKNG